jgi:hypothetical protein
VLTYILEEELVSYCLMMEGKFFGLTTRSIKTMAFELAIKNGLAHLFSVQGRAGWKWMCNFMCCHPHLRLCVPQVTSAARVKRFMQANVANFLDIFVPLLWLINASPHSLFNYDKRDLTVIQHKVCTVISLKGKQRVHLSSVERDSFMTIATCINATIIYVPHLLVFPRS